MANAIITPCISFVTVVCIETRTCQNACMGTYCNKDTLYKNSSAEVPLIGAKGLVGTGVLNRIIIMVTATERSVSFCDFS